MKTLNTILLALLCLLYACTEPAKHDTKRSAADSAEIVAKATKMANDMVQHAKDSAAQAEAAKPVQPVKYYGPCPVAVKECVLVDDRHGKSIIVKVKNNSAKKIDVIGVSWVVFNKRNQRIGSSSGKAKKVLARGKSGSYAWGINAASGTHAKASVYSIHYNDGSVWLSGDGAL